MRRFRGCQRSWYLLKTLYKYIYAKTWPIQAWIPVVSWSLYFWKRAFSFRADSSLKSDGGLYQTESFLTACISLVHEPDKPWSRKQPSCTNTRKELRRCVRRFLCPIGNRHLLESFSLRSWRYRVGARLKFWRRSRVPEKGVGTIRSWRLHRQISLDYITTAPSPNLTRLLHNTASYAG